jgi:hypothetical protein
LDVALRKSQQVEQNIAQSINLLVEYRSAMITAAVTGHIEELR